MKRQSLPSRDKQQESVKSVLDYSYGPGLDLAAARSRSKVCRVIINLQMIYHFLFLYTTTYLMRKEFTLPNECTLLYTLPRNIYSIYN